MGGARYPESGREKEVRTPCDVLGRRAVVPKSLTSSEKTGRKT